MSDYLALANVIEDGGIRRDKAVAIALVIVDLVHGSVATRADVQASEAALRADLRANITAVRTELKADISRLGHQLTMRGLAALVSGLGILFAALHYWPAHG